MIELTQGSTASGKVLYLGQKTYSRLWYAQECKLKRMDGLSTMDNDDNAMSLPTRLENGNAHILNPASLKALLVLIYTPTF